MKPLYETEDATLKRKQYKGDPDATTVRIHVALPRPLYEAMRDIAPGNLSYWAREQFRNGLRKAEKRT